jgi:hypothetical protein
MLKEGQQMPTRISMKHSVVINAPIQAVFAFVSDLSKDPLWRSEVDRMEFDGPNEVGTLVVEYSTMLGGLTKTVTPTLI